MISEKDLRKHPLQDLSTERLGDWRLARTSAVPAIFHFDERLFERS
jgi:hypothetical protein